MESGPESERHDIATNLEWALRVGEVNLRVLDLLDIGHKERFGIPTPTSVNSVPLPGKVLTLRNKRCIIVWVLKLYIKLRNQFLNMSSLILYPRV